MKIFKKLIVIFTITIICINFSACWNYREINDMPMIIGVAIDKNEDKYILTGQVMKPAIVAEKEKRVRASFIQTEGETIFDAIRDFIIKSGKKVYWGHLTFIIVSEEIAREGISAVLDMFSRDDEIREDMWLLVSVGAFKAHEILRKTTEEEEVGFYVHDVLESINSISKYDAFKLYEFRDDLFLKGKDGMLPLISMQSIVGENRAVVYGGAIFKRDKMVGIIDAKEAKSLRVLTDREKGGVLPVVWSEAGRPTKVTLEIENTKTKVTPMYKDNSIYMKIDITTNGVIGEVMDYRVDVISEEGRKKFSKQAEKIIKRNTVDLIEKAQKEFQSDIFGFGEKVKNKMPRIWREVEDNWDNVFSQVGYEVNVKVNVTGSALYADPLKVEE